MSKPRGKAIQRKLADLARSILEPWGCKCELDFSKRGGHQQLRVQVPGRVGIVSLEIVSTPRDEDQALTLMRQRCNRLIRDNLMPQR